MKKAKATGGKKSSSVIRTGTGSGIGVRGGSTTTHTSEPKDKKGLGRAPKGALA